jgi:hypothetical protein
MLATKAATCPKEQFFSPGPFLGRFLAIWDSIMWRMGGSEVSEGVL